MALPRQHGEPAPSPSGLSIPDPGDGGDISIVNGGTCPLVSGGAEETRNVPAPLVPGQILTILFLTDGGGDVKVTFGGGTIRLNKAGNNQATFADANDRLSVVSAGFGDTLGWTLLSNDGPTLATV